MNMQNIRTRDIAIESGGKNYLRGLKAMVRKVEDNKTRAQFWATILLTLSMAFFPWLGFQLVEKGRMEAKQELHQQQTESLKQTIEAQKKEIEALKLQQATEDVKATTPKPKPQTRRNKNRYNGKASNLPYADQVLPASSVAPVRSR
jgi:hypothetical protein